MSESSFLTTHEGSTSVILSGNPPNLTYKLQDLFGLDGLPVGVVVGFSAGMLVLVRIFVATGAQSWAEWSEAEELAHREKLEHAIAAKYGNNRVFQWGSVCAAYDPRSGSASLSVRYA